jgi:hypothetical protein
LIFSRNALSQEQGSKVLTKLPEFDNTPIRISNIRLNGRTLSIKERFMSNDQWLKRVEFEIQNISDKNIIALELVLLVQTEKSPNPFGLSIRYGMVDFINGNTIIRNAIPGLDDIGDSGVGSVSVISPNSTVTLRCSDEEFAKLQNLLSSGISKIDSASIYIAMVAFDNKTIWRGGHILEKDKTNNRWVPQDKVSKSQPPSLLKQSSPQLNSSSFAQLDRPISRYALNILPISTNLFGVGLKKSPTLTFVCVARQLLFRMSFVV